MGEGVVGGGGGRAEYGYQVSGERSENWWVAGERSEKAFAGEEGGASRAKRE